MKNNASLIKKQFIKDLNNYSLDSINVASLCKELNIQRQTFYYHFRDVYDLTESILVDMQNDLFLNVDNSYFLTKILEFIKAYFLTKILEFIKDESRFFVELIRGNLKELVIKFLSNLLIPCVQFRLDEFDEIKYLSKKEVNEIINYHKTAISNLIINELKDEDNYNISITLNKIEIFINKKVLELNIKYINENRNKI